MKRYLHLGLFGLLASAQILMGGNDVKSSSVIGIWKQKTITVEACTNQTSRISLVPFTNSEWGPLRFIFPVEVTAPAAAGSFLTAGGDLVVPPSYEFDASAGTESYTVRAQKETATDIFFQDADVMVKRIHCLD